jgi:hypothetical protein
MNRWGARWDAWLANRYGLALQPDDRLFVAMLTAWVILVAIVAFLLLGWESAGAIIIVAGLLGMGTVAVQSRQHRRQERKRVAVLNHAK